MSHFNSSINHLLDAAAEVKRYRHKSRDISNLSTMQNQILQTLRQLGQDPELLVPVGTGYFAADLML